jgi:hypothetical protein
VRLEAHGIALDLPHGWDGRVWSRPGGGPVLHAANIALPPSDGDFATGATATLPADGVVVVLVDYGTADAGTPLYAAPAPTRVDPGELSPATLLHRRPGQRGVQRFFTTAGRAMCLYVVVGSAAHAADLAAGVSGVLATLRVVPAGPSTGT